MGKNRKKIQSLKSSTWEMILKHKNYKIGRQLKYIF